MRCPKCGGRDSYVKDTRSAFDDTTIRRRRVCCRCKEAFTTFEIKAVDFRVLQRLGDVHEAFATVLTFFEFLRENGVKDG